MTPEKNYTGNQQVPPASATLEAFRLNECRYHDLSEEDQDLVRLQWQEARLGFSPDILFSAAGVTFEGRQEVCMLVHRLCGPETSPPARLVLDPDNPHDPHAIKILVGTSANDLTGEWRFEQVGFVPKRWCPSCRQNLTGKDADLDQCKYCGAFLSDDKTYLNQYLGQLIREDKLVANLDQVNKNPDKPKQNYGVRIGIKVLGEPVA